MCEHDIMEKLDVLRPQVELWGCSDNDGLDCDYEELRVYHGLYGDYTVA